MSRNSKRQRGGRPTLDSYQAPRISTKKPEGEPVEVKRIPLFYIDEREFSVAAELPPAVGMRYLRNVRDGTVDAATAELLTEALGEDAFDALSECDQVDRAQMTKIVDMVMGIALGGVDPGNS